jgi:hypothetical protein
MFPVGDIGTDDPYVFAFHRRVEDVLTEPLADTFPEGIRLGEFVHAYGFNYQVPCLSGLVFVVEQVLKLWVEGNSDVKVPVLLSDALKTTPVTVMQALMICSRS